MKAKQLSLQNRCYNRWPPIQSSVHMWRLKLPRPPRGYGKSLLPQARSLGRAGQACQAGGLDNLGEQRGHWPGFSPPLGGRARLRVPWCRQGPLWFESPNHTRDRGTQIFLSACPDVGQKE